MLRCLILPLRRDSKWNGGARLGGSDTKLEIKFEMLIVITHNCITCVFIYNYIFFVFEITYMFWIWKYTWKTVVQLNDIKMYYCDEIQSIMGCFHLLHYLLSWFYFICWHLAQMGVAITVPKTFVGGFGCPYFAPWGGPATPILSNWGWIATLIPASGGFSSHPLGSNGSGWTTTNFFS